MNNIKPIHNSSVINLDRDGFDTACKNLMDMVLRDWQPTALIGIRSGGLYVAESMAKACPFHIPVLAITCRRPTTRLKMASSSLRRLLTGLPRPLLDRLRIVEHRLITQKSKLPKPGAREIDPAELEILDDGLAEYSNPSLLIVDDSVDSGVTLAIVSDAIRRRTSPGTTIRSATITLTTQNPVAVPDYILIHQKLCRFPWSLDAQCSPTR